MQPDNRLMERSGLFDTECLADFTGNDAAISRLILINRWLQVLPADPPCPQTIAKEPDAVNLPDVLENNHSSYKNPSPPDPAFLFVKTGAHALVEQRNNLFEKIREGRNERTERF